MTALVWLLVEEPDEPTIQALLEVERRLNTPDPGEIGWMVPMEGPKDPEI